MKLNEIIHAVRSLAARPIWLPLARESALFLGLTLALISIDSQLGMGSLWWSMPLIALAAVLACLGASRLNLRPRHLGWIMLGLLYLILQSERLTNGPGEPGETVRFWGGLPATGVNEALDWCVMLVAAASLWLYASALPLRAAWILAGALLVGWINAWMIPPRGPGIDPATLSLFLALAAAITVALRATWQARSGGFGFRSESARSGASWLALLLAAACALTVSGLFSHSRVTGQPGLYAQADFHGSAAQVETGRLALGNLWSQSLLFGWGREALPRLVEVLVEPAPVHIPLWPGFFGFLASGGLISLVLFAFVALMIVQRMQCSSLFDTGLALGLTALSFVFLGIVVFGGVLTAIPMLLTCLCFALMLRLPLPQSPAPDVNSAAPPALLGNRLCMATLGFMAICLLFVSSGPVRGSAMHIPLRPESMTPEQYREREYRAMALNPHTAAIPMALASSWRETMSRTPRWSESYYLTTVDLYHQALRADPYNTLATIRLAELQALADREEAAFATIEAALALRPRAVDLIQWGFLKAVNLDQMKTAYLMLDRGLRVAPDDATWWRRSFRLAHGLGDTQLAGRSLAIALTANPGNPEQIQEAMALAGAGESKESSAVTLESLEP